MLNVFTNLKVKIEENEEEVDMCKAWDDWYECGKSEGIERGIEQGIEQNRVVSLQNVIKQLGYTIEQALQLLMVPEEEWSKYKNII